MDRRAIRVLSGCGIASVANILGKTYAQMKAIANAMGIEATDDSLWSDTRYVRHHRKVGITR